MSNNVTPLPLEEVLKMNASEFREYSNSLAGSDPLENNDLVTSTDSQLTSTSNTSTTTSNPDDNVITTTNLPMVDNDEDEDLDTTTTIDNRVVIASRKLITLLDLVNSISTNSSAIEKKMRFYRVLSRATTTPLDAAMKQLGVTDSTLSDAFTLGYKEPYLKVNPGSIWKLTHKESRSTSLDTTYIDQDSLTPSVHSNDYSLVTETYYLVYDTDIINDSHKVEGISLITPDNLLEMRSSLGEGDSVELVHDVRPEKVTIDNTGNY